MTYNVISSSVVDYLNSIADSYPTDKLAELLDATLKRPLCKELSKQKAPDNLHPVDSLPDGAQGWARQAFNEGQTLYLFAPDDHMKEQVRHVADWLFAALANGEPWLHKRDPQGVPQKLAKIGSLEQAVKEADKAMILASQKAAAMPFADADGELTVMTFADGYRIVQLLTPTALDRESVWLGHCVGDGGYDHKLALGQCRFYSLRGPQGKGHATLEVRGHDLLQCKGRQNKPPVSRYLGHVQDFLKRERFVLKEAPSHTGLVKGEDGAYHDICNLPDGLSVGGNLDLRRTAITALPDGLSVGGNLDLHRTAITALPDGLSVGGNLDLRGTAITALPDGLSVGGNLDLRDTAITALPDGLSVGGNLDLYRTVITVLPKNLAVGGRIFGRPGFALDDPNRDISIYFSQQAKERRGSCLGSVKTGMGEWREIEYTAISCESAYLWPDKILVWQGQNRDFEFKVSMPALGWGIPRLDI